MSRILLIILFIFTTAGCNTIDGMGKDIEKAGEAVQKSTE